MPSDYDPSEFIDRDLRSGRKTTTMTPNPGGRAPSREEVESRASETQQRLAELKRAQEELERERAQIEELRRRQSEFQLGREEMAQHLTRGIGLLEEAEFNARREAEQMSKCVGDLRENQAKVQGLTDEYWTKENLNVELTKALTTIENARMEWNSALMKFPALLGGSGAAEGGGTSPSSSASGAVNALASMDFFQLCKIGLAFTWPLAAVVGGILVVLIFRR
jgi:hypothetical protein